MKSFDLDKRMIEFSIKVIELTEQLPKTNPGIYFSDQMLRSVSSAILNYSEAQSAESRKDFIHKVKLSLKELRETYSGLRIIKRLFKNETENLDWTINESNQLIGILVTSIKTARKNMHLDK